MWGIGCSRCGASVGKTVLILEPINNMPRLTTVGAGNSLCFLQQAHSLWGADLGPCGTGSCSAARWGYVHCLGVSGSRCGACDESGVFALALGLRGVCCAGAVQVVSPCLLVWVSAHVRVTTFTVR